MSPLRNTAVAKTLGLPMKEIIVAPMVDASELPFRMLCRKYGAKLCWTPMLHSRIFLESSTYRKEKFTTAPEDRPLIAQFCGHDPEVLVKAARMVEDKVDAVDLNLGCPQGIARKGRYGAFLLGETELLENIVSQMSKSLSVPVTCKIRILPGPDIEGTIKLAQRLEKAGCSVLTIHGRTKEQNKELVGAADWEAIRRIRESIGIPVVANGGIGTRKDVERCLEETGVEGVMSSEAILENPALAMREGTMPEPAQIALDYLDMVEKYPENRKIVRSHLFKFLSGSLEAHPVFRQRICTVPFKGEFLPHFRQVVTDLLQMHTSGECTLDRCKTQQEDFGVHYDRYQHSNSKLYSRDESGKLIRIGVPESRREEVLEQRASKKKRKAELRVSREERLKKAQRRKLICEGKAPAS